MSPAEVTADTIINCSGSKNWGKPNQLHFPKNH